MSLQLGSADVNFDALSALRRLELTGRSSCGTMCLAGVA